MELKKYSVDEQLLERLPLSYKFIKYNDLVSAEEESKYVVRRPEREFFKVYTPYDRLISKVLDYSTLKNVR